MEVAAPVVLVRRGDGIRAAASAEPPTLAKRDPLASPTPVRPLATLALTPPLQKQRKGSTPLFVWCCCFLREILSDSRVGRMCVRSRNQRMLQRRTLRTRPAEP